MAWTPQEHIDYQKSKYDQRREAGLCPRCGNKPEEGRKICEKCAAYQAEHQKKRQLGDGQFTDIQLAYACRSVSQLVNGRLKDALLEAARRFKPEGETI